MRNWRLIFLLYQKMRSIKIFRKKLETLLWYFCYLFICFYLFIYLCDITWRKYVVGSFKISIIYSNLPLTTLTKKSYRSTCIVSVMWCAVLTPPKFQLPHWVCVALVLYSMWSRLIRKNQMISMQSWLIIKVLKVVLVL